MNKRVAIFRDIRNGVPSDFGIEKLTPTFLSAARAYPAPPQDLCFFGRKGLGVCWAKPLVLLAKKGLHRMAQAVSKHAYKISIDDTFSIHMSKTCELLMTATTS